MIIFSFSNFKSWKKQKCINCCCYYYNLQSKAQKQFIYLHLMGLNSKGTCWPIEIVQYSTTELVRSSLYMQFSHHFIDTADISVIHWSVFKLFFCWIFQPASTKKYTSISQKPLKTEKLCCARKAFLLSAEHITLSCLG